MGRPERADGPSPDRESPAIRALADSPPVWTRNLDVSPDPRTRAILLTRALSFRNFAGFPFVVSAPPQTCGLIAEKALALGMTSRLAAPAFWRLADCPQREIRMLREREILPMRSRPFPGKKAFKYLAVSPGGGSWILVNEVEHATFGRIFPGCPTPERLEAGIPLPEEAANHDPWAWSARFGYLTSDPSRIGPGFAVESVLHLPGLALSRRLPQARNYLAAAGVGFLPVSSPSPHAATPGAADAGLFRAASRGGLGKSPKQVYEAFHSALRPVLREEYAARERCLEKQGKRLEERVHHSLRILSGSASIPIAEFSMHASFVRLGADLGMLDPRIPGILEELRVMASGGHLSVTSGRELPKEEEDFSRSDVVRLSLRMDSGEIS